MMFKYSVVIPVYNNELTICELFVLLEDVASQLNGKVEIIFVNDSSLDSSPIQILECSQRSTLEVKLLHHSRNFGSFSAVRTGLEIASGEFVGVISADLQEPPNLLISFFARLESEPLDIIFGSRIARNDPIISRFFSTLYWFLYRKFINKVIPRNGVDVFACKKEVVAVVNKLRETNTSLIAMLFWVGFRRGFEEYERLARVQGQSSWTFSKKLKYMADSIFSFSDLPIRVIRMTGLLGSLISLSLGLFLLIASLTGNINVPGYVPIMLAILLGNSAILIGLGIIGSYLWRTYQNTQMRPFAIAYNTEPETNKK